MPPRYSGSIAATLQESHMYDHLNGSSELHVLAESRRMRAASCSVQQKLTYLDPQVQRPAIPQAPEQSWYHSV